MGENISFEVSMKELEDIVKKLESGDIELNEAMGLFEKGVKLTRECSGLLNAARQKVTELIKNAEGEMEEAPMENDK
jgi:exodeoxyribonuclease VII small subunit